MVSPVNPRHAKVKKTASRKITDDDLEVLRQALVSLIVSELYSQISKMESENRVFADSRPSIRFGGQ
jgi:hypothetical protein